MPKILIVNPLEGPGLTKQGPGYTTLNRAKRYITRADAKWVVEGVSIRFERDTKHSTSVARCIQRKYTDSHDDGMAMPAAIKGLPIAGPVERLLTGKRPKFPPRQDRVIFLRSQRVAVDADQLLAAQWARQREVAHQRQLEDQRRTAAQR